MHWLEMCEPGCKVRRGGDRLEQGFQHIMCFDQVIDVHISQEGEVFDHKSNESTPRTTVVTLFIFRNEFFAFLLEGNLTRRRICTPQLMHNLCIQRGQRGFDDEQVLQLSAISFLYDAYDLAKKLFNCEWSHGCSATAYITMYTRFSLSRGSPSKEQHDNPWPKEFSTEPKSDATYFATFAVHTFERVRVCW